MIGETVYVVVVDLFEHEMGPTYCECCGPETEYVPAGSEVDSVHASEVGAQLRMRAINMFGDFTKYDGYDDHSSRIERKVLEDNPKEDE